MPLTYEDLQKFLTVYDPSTVDSNDMSMLKNCLFVMNSSKARFFDLLNSDVQASTLDSVLWAFCHDFFSYEDPTDNPMYKVEYTAGDFSCRSHYNFRFYFIAQKVADMTSKNAKVIELTRAEKSDILF